MYLTPSIASEILTGLHGKTFEAYAEPPAKGDEDFQGLVDEVSELVDRWSYDMVSALAEYIKMSSESVETHELKDFTEKHYRGSGGRVGEVLMQHAQDSEMGELGKLFTALDEAGAVHWFDWDGYADSGQSPIDGLHFIKVPVTGAGSDDVFLFEDI